MVPTQSPGRCRRDGADRTAARRGAGRDPARVRTRRAAHRGGRQGWPGRPDQVAQAGEARAHAGTGVQVLRDRDLLEELERLERTPHARARTRAGLHDRPVIGVPLRRIRPAVGLVKPVRASTIVVFPAPFGPIRPTTSPGATWKLTPSTATTAPKRTVRSSISSVAGVTSLGCDVDELLARRGAPPPETQLADAALVVEHHARDAVRVEDHDEDERDATDGDDPRTEIDPVEWDRSQSSGARFPPNTAPSTQPTPPATALPTVLIDWNGS